MRSFKEFHADWKEAKRHVDFPAAVQKGVMEPRDDRGIIQRIKDRNYNPIKMPAKTHMKIAGLQVAGSAISNIGGAIYMHKMDLPAMPDYQGMKIAGAVAGAHVVAAAIKRGKQVYGQMKKMKAKPE